MRLVLAIVALALLSGCNVVMTKDPLFTKADEAGAAPMRPGVWDTEPAPDCKVDESKPLTEWPSCASGFVVRGDGTAGSYKMQDGKPVWQSAPFIVAAGDPLVFQAQMTGSLGDAAMPPVYVYAAVKPTKLDDQGRIVASVSWPVLCGPQPPKDAKGADGNQRSGTLHPFAGLTMDASANDCTTTSQDAVRGAAGASRKFTAASDISSSHWVRDGDK